MALLESQLEVKNSILPGADKGLFTRRPIKKGSRIVEYKGRITTWKEIDNEDANRYIFYINRNHVIDAAPYKKALARFANDARGLSRVKGVTNNAVYEEDGLRVYITAKKDIPAGQEILVDYGKEYWDSVRHNIKIDKEREREKAGSS